LREKNVYFLFYLKTAKHIFFLFYLFI